jgi:hypothetical protein
MQTIYITHIKLKSMLINTTPTMKNEDKKVDHIKKEIKNLENDIESIQEKCPHTNYTVKFVMDSRSVRRICNDCEKDLGYASTDELKKNGFNK